MKFPLRASFVAIAFALTSPVSMAENIKIAYIDPLSGPFAPVGQNILNSFQYIADKANAEKWAGNNITQIGEQPADREEWNGKPNKLQYLEK